MNEAAEIITATADACQLARAYACRIELHIGPGRFRTVGQVDLVIDPLTLAGEPPRSNTPADTMPLPAAAAAAAAVEVPPKGPGYP